VDIVLNENELKIIEDIVAKYPDIGQRYSDGALKLVNN